VAFRPGRASHLERLAWNRTLGSQLYGMWCDAYLSGSDSTLCVCVCVCVCVCAWQRKNALMTVSYSCWWSMFVHAERLTEFCGNHKVEGSEDCDEGQGGECCSASCQFKPGAVCRSAFLIAHCLRTDAVANLYVLLLVCLWSPAPFVHTASTPPS